MVRHFSDARESSEISQGALYKQFGTIHNNTIDVQGCLDQFNSLEIIVEITGRAHNMYPVMSRVSTFRLLIL